MVLLSTNHSPTPPCALHRQTSFGQFISPLYDELGSLPDSDHPAHSRKWLVAALPKIAKFYTPDLKVSHIELTPVDQLFLMGDPIGDILRRVHLHKWLSEKVQEGVDSLPPSPPLSQEERSFLLSSVEWIRRFGFSSFMVQDRDFLRSKELRSIVPEIDIQITTPAFKAMKQGPGPFLLARLSEFFVSLRDELNQKALEISPWYEAIDNKAVVMTDPLHCWEALYTTIRFLWYDPSKIHLPSRLETPEHLMVVEDSSVHQLAFEPLRTIENLTWFAPDTEHPVAITHPESLQGYYPTAESALATIEDALLHGKPLPTVICSDIELSKSGMDGLTLMARVDALLKEAGRRNEVILATVSSSHISLFEHRIATLIAAGVINRAWSKTNFEMPDFINVVQMARKAAANVDN